MKVLYTLLAVIVILLVLTIRYWWSKYSNRSPMNKESNMNINDIIGESKTVFFTQPKEVDEKTCNTEISEGEISPPKQKKSLIQEYKENLLSDKNTIPPRLHPKSTPKTKRIKPKF